MRLLSPQMQQQQQAGRTAPSLQYSHTRTTPLPLQRLSRVVMSQLLLLCPPTARLLLHDQLWTPGRQLWMQQQQCNRRWQCRRAQLAPLQQYSRMCRRQGLLAQRLLSRCRRRHGPTVRLRRHSRTEALLRPRRQLLLTTLQQQQQPSNLRAPSVLWPTHSRQQAQVPMVPHSRLRHPLLLLLGRTAPLQPHRSSHTRGRRVLQQYTRPRTSWSTRALAA